MAQYSNAFVLVIAFMVVFPIMVLGGTAYHVGRAADWNDHLFDYQGWAWSINFQVGDSLVFSYHADVHSIVVAANRVLYDGCSSTPNLGVYQSGYEELVLPVAGTYYFFCGNQCNQGMKFVVTV
ncbi:mavicyanin-like [Rosa rugosa]|uniref:mavicyanin-like n=1 Tax=Rosa rugosa TaxID=74645 RepID=UPI002B4023FE|nr:mavicyanin-like [Rosa rugosa]